MRKLGYASYILDANSLVLPQEPRAAGPTPILMLREWINPFSRLWAKFQVI